MLSRTNILLLTLFSVLALQACAIAPHGSQITADSVRVASAQPAAELDSLTEGDTAVFYTGLLAPLGQVTIGREYFAASGRQCKQILSATGTQLLSVACKVQKDNWYIRESLDMPADSRSELLVPVDPAQNKGDNVLPVVQEGISYSLEKDETLWSFARRTTGNALNWEAIAQHNKLKNESVLKAGMPLRVPSALQSAGR